MFDIIYMYVLVCLGKKIQPQKEVKTTKHIYKYIKMYVSFAVCLVFFLIALILHYAELH